MESEKAKKEKQGGKMFKEMDGAFVKGHRSQLEGVLICQNWDNLSSSIHNDRNELLHIE
jgi:hypothetical protein